MKLRLALLAWCGLALITTSPAIAREYIILSDKYGEATYIGFPHNGEVGTDFKRTDGSRPSDILTPRAMTHVEAVELFATLCLASPFNREAYDAARTGVAKDFVTKSIVLKSSTSPNPLFGSKTQPEFTFAQEEASYGYASLWLNEKADALPGRQSYTYYPRGVRVTSIGKNDYYGPQCNLTLRISGLKSTKDLFDGIQSSVANSKLIKRVEKPNFGYAIWTSPAINGRIPRITAKAEGLDEIAQILHITTQLLPAGKVQ